MIGAIGSGSPFALSGNGQATVGLQAQLARYQTELAQWQSCPSCKTPEGKAKIADLSNKIGEIKQRIDAAQAVDQRQPVNQITQDSTSTNRVEAAGGAEKDYGSNGSTAQPVRQYDGPLGRGIDIFA